MRFRTQSSVLKRGAPFAESVPLFLLRFCALQMPQLYSRFSPVSGSKKCMTLLSKVMYSFSP